MDELKKNQIYEAEITGYTSTGAGVCRIGGRAVFVPLALAGEVWDVQILKVSSSAVYGKGVELKRASPARAVPDFREGDAARPASPETGLLPGAATFARDGDR